MSVLSPVMSYLCKFIKITPSFMTYMYPRFILDACTCIKKVLSSSLSQDLKPLVTFCMQNIKVLLHIFYCFGVDNDKG